MSSRRWYRDKDPNSEETDWITTLMVRVLVVDDHPLFRQGLAAMLSKTSDVNVVAEASDGDEALVMARKHKPDLVLLDIAMPGKDGMEVLNALNSEMPDVKVLVLSAFPDKQYAVRCLKSGAKGYVTKSTAPEEIMTAIRMVISGRNYISASLAEWLASHVRSALSPLPHEKLSDREFQVLCLLGQGKTISQIANTLSLSLSTVSTHRAHILEKMGMETNAQLMRYVIDHNLALTTG